ncbi:excalibur domain-containing protein [Mycolicibacterium pyrenivorans]|uniref:excalibur domain-containing protein n=1 Tax=Mycolicibacterium pyrenivorans TaxID=187102 RepID=UPI0021F27793|nr:excalibur domain-containing protein [Mycolicibacterium pyrenivorans]MCV7154573.1 excalibur domain-containing protein [Mycolicibacterium pyrenivorans]
MRKLTVVTIGFAAGLALAPAAAANTGDGWVAQSSGPYAVPAPLQQSSSCDSNYSGACVPIASDVDCAGGSGNGPAYVSGPVTVVGDDIYGLDRDGNGVACE